MLKIWTAQMAIGKQDQKLAVLGLVKADCLDITIGSGKGLGSYFAPNWDMVNGIKNGTMTEFRYKKLYNELLDKRIADDPSPWKFLLHKDKIVLLCYCRWNEFCHRFELKDRYVAEEGAQYMGEIR